MKTHSADFPYTVHKLELLEKINQTHSYVPENQCPLWASSGHSYTAEIPKWHTANGYERMLVSSSQD